MSYTHAERIIKKKERADRERRVGMEKANIMEWIFHHQAIRIVKTEKHSVCCGRISIWRLVMAVVWYIYSAARYVYRYRTISVW